MAPIFYLAIALSAYAAMEFLRSRGRECLGWSVLIVIGFPAFSAALMYYTFPFNPNANPLAIHGFVAEKVGGLLVVSVISLIGMASPSGKIIISIVILSVLGNYPYLTGNDPLNVDLPNYLPTVGAAIALIGLFAFSKTEAIRHFFG